MCKCQENILLQLCWCEFVSVCGMPPPLIECVVECVFYRMCSLSDMCEFVSGLWNATASYMRSQGITETPPLLRQHLSIDHGSSSSNTTTLTWDRSYYYTNFEIGYLPFFRSEPYQSYFRHLDSEGGFYYYRWGDAPIRLLGVCVCVCVCV